LVDEHFVAVEVREIDLHGQRRARGSVGDGADRRPRVAPGLLHRGDVDLHLRAEADLRVGEVAGRQHVLVELLRDEGGPRVVEANRLVLPHSSQTESTGAPSAWTSPRRSATRFSNSASSSVARAADSLSTHTCGLWISGRYPNHPCPTADRSSLVNASIP